MAWQRLARDVNLAKLELLATEIGFSDAIASADLLMQGKKLRDGLSSGRCLIARPDGKNLQVLAGIDRYHFSQTD
jgi:hypothetical protein